MLIKTDLVLLPEEAASEVVWKEKALQKAGINVSDVSAIKLSRRSVDARSKKVIVNLTVHIYTGDTIPESPQNPFQLRDVHNAETAIVIGCGPAGMFAALRLIELGIKPVLIERGKDVKQRRRDLALLNKERIVNPDSNYCFGEGGAGTYSDGKLYTWSGKRGNVNKVLDTFIAYGASTEIGIDAHPHIGTNKLPGIIEAMRNAIAECGGEIHFNQRFTGFILEGNKIKGVQCVLPGSAANTTNFRSKAVILATGHSARDVFEILHNNNITVEAKPFALGVRIEHPQTIIDSIQYHCETRSQFLPPAPYTLSTQAQKRGVYSFCMCPGGIIAVAATATGEVVVNGWSPSKRNNPFANSGIVVSVGENDFKPFSGHGELRAMRFQQHIERLAFAEGGKNLSAPAQRLMDFINHKNSASLPPCSYIPGINSVNLDNILPSPLSTALREGLKIFGSKMRGYLTNDAVLVAVESRTSSPVKIPRNNESLMHPQITGLFPCGEGAGYAGGIMSAAMDGERVATSAAAFLHKK